MAMAGDNLPGFLQNLDSLHICIGLRFPQLKPPSFQCNPLRSDELHLHYHSSREGVGPMVIGLLKGLESRFNQDIEMTQIQDRQQGADHDKFSIHKAASQQ